MEKEADQVTCCSSRLESEFSLFGSGGLVDQSGQASRSSIDELFELGRKKKKHIGFGTVSKRFALPPLHVAVTIAAMKVVGPGSYTVEMKWLACENMRVTRKAAPFNST